MLTAMTEDDWAIVLQVFRAVRSRRGDKGRDDRKFLEALHYFTVHNITWRALSAEFGPCLSGCHPQPLAVVWPCSWTFTSVAIFGSHNRCQSSSDFSLTIRPVPATWRRLAGATGSFAPIVRRRESRSASQIVLASCAAAGAAVIRR